MKIYLCFITLLFLSKVHANTQVGCSLSGLFETPKSFVLENIEENNCTKESTTDALIIKTLITEHLDSVNVLHETEEVVIEREITNKEFSCPPFCIEPMQIKEVVTVAELEVLDFINRLKEKKARLLIDIRENNFYKEGTIPGAINLPSSMLKDESKYQIEVLKLLGAKRNNTKSNLKWSFKNALSLLIFGSSATSDDASSSVKKLLELGYPSSKLLYYRTGFQSWKALGLTII